MPFVFTVPSIVSFSLFGPTVFLGVMDLAKQLLFCINNGSVTLANPFHLVCNDLCYISRKENKRYEPLTDLRQPIQAITALKIYITESQNW